METKSYWWHAQCSSSHGFFVFCFCIVHKTAWVYAYEPQDPIIKTHSNVSRQIKNRGKSAVVVSKCNVNNKEGCTSLMGMFDILLVSCFLR